MSMKLCRICGHELHEESIDTCDFCTERLTTPPYIAPMDITECLEEIVGLVLPDCAKDSRWDRKIRTWLERAGYRYNDQLEVLECITPG